MTIIVHGYIVRSNVWRKLFACKGKVYFILHAIRYNSYVEFLQALFLCKRNPTCECRNTTHEFSPESCLRANGIRDLDTEGLREKLALLKDGPLRVRLSSPFPPFPFKLTRLPSNLSSRILLHVPLPRTKPSPLLTHENIVFFYFQNKYRTVISMYFFF